MVGSLFVGVPCARRAARRSGRIWRTDMVDWGYSQFVHALFGCRLPSQCSPERDHASYMNGRDVAKGPLGNACHGGLRFF